MSHFCHSARTLTKKLHHKSKRSNILYKEISNKLVNFYVVVAFSPNSDKFVSRLQGFPGKTDSSVLNKHQKWEAAQIASGTLRAGPEIKE